MRQSINSLRIGITKRYAAKTVLDDLRLEIRGGEFVTFLGPSGCGKSTALSIIAGLIPASDGEIWLDDKRIDHVLPEKRGFGMVFQNYALFPHMTVFDNVAFGLSLQRLPALEIRQRVDAMLRLVQLAGFEDRYPGQLSGGQQQRVAIARALVRHPPLLLLDEPLSNLDAKLRVEMRAEIKQIHAEMGLTSIYVTHDQSEALSLSDRIVVLRAGELMQMGSPQEIHDRPRNRFVADFMGFRNFFDVRLAESVEPGFLEARNAKLALRVPLDGGPSAGSDAVLAVRPEDVVIGNPAAGVNTMRGRVEITEYLGREHELRVELDGGAKMWLRTDRPVTAGETLDLHFPPDKIVLLPPDPD